MLKQFLGVWLVLVFYWYILSNRHACLKQPKSITMKSWNSDVWNKFQYCRIKVLSELYFLLRLCLWEILFLSVLSSRICILNWQFFPLFHSHCIRSSVFFFFLILTFLHHFLQRFLWLEIDYRIIIYLKPLLRFARPFLSGKAVYSEALGSIGWTSVGSH